MGFGFTEKTGYPGVYHYLSQIEFYYEIAIWRCFYTFFEKDVVFH